MSMSLVNVYLEGFHKTATFGIGNTSPVLHVPTDKLAHITTSLPQNLHLEQYLFAAIEVLQLSAGDQDRLLQSVEDFCHSYLDALKQGPLPTNSGPPSHIPTMGGVGGDLNDSDDDRGEEGEGGGSGMASGVGTPTAVVDVHAGSRENMLVMMHGHDHISLDNMRRGGAPGPDNNTLNSHFEGEGGACKKRRGNLPKLATNVLKKWLFDHLFHPYPTEEEKAMLAAQTNLSLNQISNWFINARRRILQPMLENVRQAQAHNIPHNPNPHPHPHHAFHQILHPPQSWDFLDTSPVDTPPTTTPTTPLAYSGEGHIPHPHPHPHYHQRT